MTAVMVVHREALVAESIASALGRFPSIACVAVATSPRQAAVEGEHMDAVVLDASFPDARETAGRLRRRGIRVVLLGGSDVDDGVSVSPSESVAALARALSPTSAAPSPSRRSLTLRERQVLSLAATGLVAKQMAKELGISVKTVERHKTRIFAKLGVPNQAAAVGVAVAEGLHGSQSWIR